MRKFIVNHVFPILVGYASDPIHIMFLLILWMMLLVCGSWTAFELVGGNYTNGLSAAASCAVLYKQIHTEKEVVKLRAENRDMHTTLNEKLDQHKQEIHERIDEHHKAIHEKLDATLTAVNK